MSFAHNVKKCQKTNKQTTQSKPGKIKRTTPQKILPPILGTELGNLTGNLLAFHFINSFK